MYESDDNLNFEVENYMFHVLFILDAEINMIASFMYCKLVSVVSNMKIAMQRILTIYQDERK